MSDERTPVEPDQVRKGEGGVYWGVLWPARRRGWWVVASHEFPFSIVEVGRRELEALPLSDLYSDPHPGIDYWHGFRDAVRSEKRG